jgi:hypothetical protein
VASLANKLFAGVDVGCRAHRLHGHSVSVEGLEINRLAHRRFEVSAAVGFDRHGAQHGSGIGLIGGSDPGLVRRRSGLGQDMDDPQGVNLASLGPRKVAVVDVHQSDRRLGDMSSRRVTSRAAWTVCRGITGGLGLERSGMGA